MSKLSKKRINSLNIFLSILAAFLAWFYVAFNVAPTVNKTYRDIPITFEGEYELGMEGLGVESASNETLAVMISLDRMDVVSMSSARINAVADVSNLTQGTNKVSVKVSCPDGMDVKSQSVSTIEVKVGKSNNVDVDVLAGYKLPSESNTEPYISQLSAEKVSVMGARDLVDEVAYVLLPIDESTMGDRNDFYTVTPIAVNSRGEEIKHVVVLPSSIRFKAIKQPLKVVKLNINVINDNASEIGRTFTVPSTVTIKGDPDILNNITSIDAETVDISGMKKNANIRVHFNLPEGVEIANPSFLTHIKVKVDK